ncbi:MAG: hypothetical protein MJK10_20760 [Pseudomonadales bacterium]|nr:hypothetical protein [Pseudomonadales bacterium]NRA18702.1 hypothetical protein [Oceanospirillaceae bacterium]
MSEINFVPGYLVDDYQLLTENIESYKDPEEPDLFNNYIDSLLAQLNKTPGFLAGMPDQLAICLLLVVKLDCAKLAPLSLHSEPAWDDVKTCVSIHKSYRPLLSTLADKFQHQLKIALLLLCYYELGATTQEFNAEKDDSEELQDHEDLDEYQGHDQEYLDEY